MGATLQTHPAGITSIYLLPLFGQVGSPSCRTQAMEEEDTETNSGGTHCSGDKMSYTWGKGACLRQGSSHPMGTCQGRYHGWHAQTSGWEPGTTCPLVLRLWPLKHRITTSPPIYITVYICQSCLGSFHLI